jgi:hypothetical protein
MAGPHAAGLAALLLSKGVAPQAVEGGMEMTANPLPCPTDMTIYANFPQFSGGAAGVHWRANAQQFLRRRRNRRLGGCPGARSPERGRAGSSTGPLFAWFGPSEWHDRGGADARLDRLLCADIHIVG